MLWYSVFSNSTQLLRLPFPCLPRKSLWVPKKTLKERQSKNKGRACYMVLALVGTHAARWIYLYFPEWFFILKNQLICISVGVQLNVSFTNLDTVPDFRESATAEHDISHRHPKFAWTNPNRPQKFSQAARCSCKLKNLELLTWI